MELIKQLNELANKDSAGVISDRKGPGQGKALGDLDAQTNQDAMKYHAKYVKYYTDMLKQEMDEEPSIREKLRYHGQMYLAHKDMA